jgi:hypothetical protein
LAVAGLAVAGFCAAGLVAAGFCVVGLAPPAPWAATGKVNAMTASAVCRTELIFIMLKGILN